MSKFMKKEKGSVLVIVALAIVVIMGFAALAIDVGVMLTAKNQLQSAVDAAALAGASGLVVSQTKATNRAITFAALNNCINQPVTITAQDVTFPTPNRVRVDATRLLNLYFARVLGMNTANITAAAVAEIATLGGTGDLKPWALPDLEWTLGDLVTLKAGELGAAGTSSGFFYPVDFPPVNRGTPVGGAQAYEENILYGAGDPVFVGDELLVEPGNMIGPTAHATNELISQDPNAHWGGESVDGSAYPGFSSPRIIKIPFYDPNLAPDSGRNTVIIVRLGAFFIEGFHGRNLEGRFIEITTSGTSGGPSFLQGVSLVM
jgi:hypothetical protein